MICPKNPSLLQLERVIDSVVERLQELKQMGYPIPNEIAGKFPGFVSHLPSVHVQDQSCDEQLPKSFGLVNVCNAHDLIQSKQPCTCKSNLKTES